MTEQHIRETIIGDGTVPVGSPSSSTGGVNAKAEAKAAEVTPAVADGSFNAIVTDLYRQLVTAAFEWATRSDRMKEQDPLTEQYNNNLDYKDDTNLPIATYYYPSATFGTMDGQAHLSLSGKLIAAAAGTLAISLEVMNDEDTSLGDPVPVYFYDDQNNVMINTYSATNQTKLIALSANVCNYRYYRWKLDVTGSATNTAILKGRQLPIS